MAPSFLGKLKTSVQFLAIILAILRPGDEIGGLYIDQWAMLAAAAITVWSAADYLIRALPAVDRGGARRVSRVFLTGGSGLIGGALAKRLVGARRRGRRARALARSRRGALEAIGAAVVRGDVLDEAGMARGDGRVRGRLPRRGRQHDVPDGPGGADPRQRPRRRGGGAGRGAGGGGRASCSPPPRRRWARRRARWGARRRRTAAATCRSTSAPSTRASSPRSRRPRSPGIPLVSVNPSSVQGPGRAGGTGRILIAYLNGRLQGFVDTTLSLVDIDDCVEAHVLAAERGVPGERYVISRRDDQRARGARDRHGGLRRAPRCQDPATRGRRRSAGTVVEGVFQRARAQAAVLPRDGPHAAARPPLRRLARPRASWAWRTRRSRRRSGARSSGRAARGLVTA